MYFDTLTVQKKKSNDLSLNLYTINTMFNYLSFYLFGLFFWFSGILCPVKNINLKNCINELLHLKKNDVDILHLDTICLNKYFMPK